MVRVAVRLAPVNAPPVAGYAVYLESLGVTRSKDVRSLEWTPDDGIPHKGTAVVVTARVRGGKASADSYRVTEVAVGKDWHGRGFVFVKACGEVRNVFLCRRGRDHRCDCDGFEYESKRRADRRHALRGGQAEVGDSLGCKHLDTARALVENRWIVTPALLVLRTVPTLPAAFPAGADGDIPNPLDAACDWCAGTNAVPDGNGQLYPCPVCCPHGAAPVQPCPSHGRPAAA